VTRQIWIIGGDIAGLITAVRLLPYGFRIHILERAAPPKIIDQIEVLPPVWPGFFHATWSLLQELSLPSALLAFRPGQIEFWSAKGQRHSIPRLPLFSGFHMFPELLLFGGLSWRDRLHLLNALEKDWEIRRPYEAIPDIRTAEDWVTRANQSKSARQQFWNPLCRWLLGCDLAEGSLHMFWNILSRYAQGTATDTQWFFGTPSTMPQLKNELRERLIKQGVQFRLCTDYPPFQFGPEHPETLSLAGDAFSPSDAFVAALSPEEIVPLLPERALTKFAQLDQMAKMTIHTQSLISFRILNSRLAPSLILGLPTIDWLTVWPSESSPSSETHLNCVVKATPEEPQLENHRKMEKTWSVLQQNLPLPPDLALRASNPELSPHGLRRFPATSGSRAFRPHTSNPLPNLFFAGPWTAASLPPSMESLVESANSCAEAIAHRFFSGLR